MDVTYYAVFEAHYIKSSMGRWVPGYERVSEPTFVLERAILDAETLRENPRNNDWQEDPDYPEVVVMRCTEDGRIVGDAD